MDGHIYVFNLTDYIRKKNVGKMLVLNWKKTDAKYINIGTRQGLTLFLLINFVHLLLPYDHQICDITTCAVCATGIGVNRLNHYLTIYHYCSRYILLKLPNGVAYKVSHFAA